MLQKFSNRMPVGAALSTDLSASIGTCFNDISQLPTAHMSPSTTTPHQPPYRRNGGPRENSLGDNLVCSPVTDGVMTRGMSVQGEAPTARPPRMRFKVGLLPCICGYLIAANSVVFMVTQFLRKAYPEEAGNLQQQNLETCVWRANKWSKCIR
ncbi:hypothetical protein M758_UG144900 [Ceratodon purpureus]|nr:hypothetical protein M758_UG144900 [Ceratodon purpureus]